MNAHGTVGQLTIGARPPTMLFAALQNKFTGPTVATGWEATMVQLFGGATEYRPSSGTFVVRAAAVYLAADRCVVLVQEAPVCYRACPCTKRSCIRYYMCTTGTPA